LRDFGCPDPQAEPSIFFLLETLERFLGVAHPKLLEKHLTEAIAQCYLAEGEFNRLVETYACRPDCHWLSPWIDAGILFGCATAGLETGIREMRTELDWEGRSV
jgi:hypothetical protein